MSLLRRLEKERVKEKEREKLPNEEQDKGEKFKKSQQDSNPFNDLKSKIHMRLIGDIEEYANSDDEDAVDLKEQIQNILAEETVPLKKNERVQLVNELLAEVKGYGPIDKFLNDPEVSEIMVNHANQVYIERGGKLELSDAKFKDDDHVHRIIERIVAPIGRRIDESSPMVDARLPDGSRVNAIIPPLAIKGPSITIRKFSKDPYKSDDLIRFGTMTPEIVELLRACVDARLNIVVSGGTGSGKTTTLNVLSSFIPSDERIVTIEDAAELQLQQEHIITLETRPANIEGKGAITMRDLVKNSLRMRPDRIVVGEVRSGEALDMLQAMNTGHDGSLTTGHANTPRDMIARLETMVLMAGLDLPVRAIREQIASAVDLIVQQSRLKDGSRKITYITEVLGMEGDTITLQDIFVYDQVQRRHRPTGIVPKCFEQLKDAGLPVSVEWFHYR
jgi:pilus assembly protein CpaF